VNLFMRLKQGEALSEDAVVRLARSIEHLPMNFQRDARALVDQSAAEVPGGGPLWELRDDFQHVGERCLAADGITTHEQFHAELGLAQSVREDMRGQVLTAVGFRAAVITMSLEEQGKAAAACRSALSQLPREHRSARAQALQKALTVRPGEEHRLRTQVAIAAVAAGQDLELASTAYGFVPFLLDNMVRSATPRRA
jgi:hypothetical protein